MSAFLQPSSNASPFRSPQNTFLKYVSICLWVWQWNYQTLRLWHDWIRLQLTSCYHCQTPFLLPKARGGGREGRGGVTGKIPEWNLLIICLKQWLRGTTPHPIPTRFQGKRATKAEVHLLKLLCGHFTSLSLQFVSPLVTYTCPPPFGQTGREHLGMSAD